MFMETPLRAPYRSAMAWRCGFAESRPCRLAVTARPVTCATGSQCPQIIDFRALIVKGYKKWYAVYVIALAVVEKEDQRAP